MDDLNRKASVENSLEWWCEKIVKQCDEILAQLAEIKKGGKDELNSKQ
jgi:hypothetical protein